MNLVESGTIGFFTCIDGTLKNLKLVMNTNLTITNVDKYAHVGILVGRIGQKNKVGNSVENCEVSGNIGINFSGWAVNLGGLVGALNGKMSGCCNKSNVLITSNVSNVCRIGGILGSMDTNAVLENSYNSGNVEVDIVGIGNDCVGGVSGLFSTNAIEVKNVYNIGNIIEKENSLNQGLKIDSCFGDNYTTKLNIGSIYSLDGLVMIKNSKTKMSNNFTLKEKSELYGQVGVDLLDYGNDTSVWVEDTNKINNGYPILKWQTENN